MLRIWLPLQEVGELSQTGEFRMKLRSSGEFRMTSGHS
jgi:hypothetical protein